MRRKPFGEIRGGELVSREVELEETIRGRAMPWRRDSASPMCASGARGNLLHRDRIRSESHGGRGNLNRRVQPAHRGAHVAELCSPEGGGRSESLPGPGDTYIQPGL